MELAQLICMGEYYKSRHMQTYQKLATHRTLVLLRSWVRANDTPDADTDLCL